MRPSLDKKQYSYGAALVAACFAVSLAGCGNPAPSVDWDQWDSPSVEYRPWVRWWWPGNDVEDEEITREVALLANNYFGGAELNSFNAALDWDADEAELARRLDWGSELFWSRVRLAAETAATNGIQLDLNVGSGWPIGGSHVTVGDSMKTLLWSEAVVAGPATVNLEFLTPGQDPFYEVAVLAESIGEPMARYLPDECQVVEVVAAKKTGGGRDPDVWNLKDQVMLDPDSVVVLTGSLTAGGALTWQAPEGDWRVIGFYSCPDGQYVNLNALAAPREAFVVDHFDAARIAVANDKLTGHEAGLDDLFGTAIRGLFVDSFELKTERHFASDFFDRFQELRGYDLRPWLPAVVPPGADNHIFDGAGIANACPFGFGAMDARVAWDYRRTVSDLFIERYVGGSAGWARDHGMQFRIQPYGLHVDSIRAAGVADVPETEQLYAGGSELSLKVMASGAHLYGRNVVSAESLVSSGRDYMTTPTKMRAWLDKLFTSGVNSVVYHGFPYQTGLEKYGETDWHAFSSPFSGLGTYSENMSEANPYWSFIDDINRHVARTQFMLRQGTPRADVLVYYPWMGIPASLMALRDHEEPFFKGQFEDEKAASQDSMLELVQGMFGGFNPDDATWWAGAVWPVLQSIEDMGYTWEWTNDDALANALVDGAAGGPGGVGLVSGQARYRAVVVMRAPWMSPEAATNLADMATAGLPVVVVGDAPAVQPGFFDHVAGDAAVDAAFDSIGTMGNFKGVAVVETPSTIENGNPRLFAAEGFAAALMDVGVRPSFELVRRDSSARMIARDMDGGRIVYVRNPTGEDQVVEIIPDLECDDGLVMDPWDGWVAPLHVLAGGHLQVTLPAWGSRFLMCGVAAPADLESRAGVAPIESLAIATHGIDGWSLVVYGEDVPGGRYEVVDGGLGDWREIDELKHSSSGAVYQATFTFPFDPIEFDVPTEERRAFYVDLGEVHGAALVSVNGAGAIPVLAEPFRLDVTSQVTSGTNTITVMLVPPLRNRLVGLGLAKDPTAAQFDKKGDTLVATGLVGPVTIEERTTPW